MTKMNLIDRAVAAVSPERGLRRAAARQGLELINFSHHRLKLIQRRKLFFNRIFLFS